MLPTPMKIAAAICLASICLVSSIQAQEVFTPQVKRATRAKPCEDRECVETFWENYDRSPSQDWSEPLRPVRVDRQFAVPLYLASWPVKPFTVMGFVYVLYKPNTHNPQTSAVRALADLAKRHGAEAVSLRPRKMMGHWYAAGTAIRWAKR